MLLLYWHSCSLLAYHNACTDTSTYHRIPFSRVTENDLVGNGSSNTFDEALLLANSGTEKEQTFSDGFGESNLGNARRTYLPL